MVHKRPADYLVTQTFLATWFKMRRWLVGIGRLGLREVRKADIRKPVHAVVVGVMVAGLLVPVLSHLADENRYRLQDSPVLTHANVNFDGKLKYDKAKKASIFNPEDQVDTTNGMLLSAGGGGKKQLYSATMPDQPTNGIKVTDNVNGVELGMRPQFGAMDGRIEAGHVVYPLTGQSGQLVFTPKANGLKEDILLDHATGDRMQLDYELDVPDSLEVRMTLDGGVGFYSGEQALFGRISYGSDKDRESVENARKNAKKTFLMFEIPAPVVKQADGQAHRVKARFELEGKILHVVVSGLNAASYPLSVDPTFLISSASDFNLGRIEDNITVTTPSGDGQINRAAITGGLTDANGWRCTSGTASADCTTTVSLLPAGCSNSGTDYQFGMTAYNGFLYLVGGGDGAQTYTCFVPINSDGTLGTWAAASNHFNTGRTGGAVVGYNGYIYVIGGETANGGTQFQTVESSAVQSNGDLGAWSTMAAQTNTGRTYFGAAVYNDYIYVCGGATKKNNGTLSATCEWSNIKADGTLGTWTQSTSAGTGSLATATDRFGFDAYYGVLYIVGGYTGSPVATVSYNVIKADHSLGTWIATTSLPAARRSGGMVIQNGYIYAYAGCSTAPACSGLLNTTVYAHLNADGTIGAWDTASNLTTARVFNGAAAYNGVLYMVGGCLAEPTNNNNCAGTEKGDSQYATISTTPGDVVAPTATTSATVARGGNGAVAYNGFMYSAGGCTGATCNTQSTTVEIAAINDDGTTGTWTTTGMTALPAARYGGALAAFNGKLYYCGGDQAGTVKSDCLSSSVNATTGLNGAWTAETNNFNTGGDNGRKLLTANIWNNYLYLIGGTDGTTFYNDIQYSQIGSTGALGTFTKATSTFTTGRIAHGSAIYNGNLYVVGGQDSGATKKSDVQRAAISSTGNITASFTTDTALPAARTYLSVVAHNSVLYVVGGITSSAATSDIIYAPMTASTGAISSWTTSARTLTVARQSFTAVAYKGYLFAVGGCTSGQVCSTYTAVTDKGLVLNGGLGQTSSSTTATSFTTSRADPQYAVMKGYLYIIGGCTAYTTGACSTWTTSVQSALINPDGSLGTWTANTALPSSVGRSYGGATVYNGYLYVIGGSISGTTEDRTVLYATANSSGTLTWTDNAANYLPATKGRNGFGIAQSGGYIYLVGGMNGGAVKNEVYYTAASNLTTTGNMSDPNSCGGGTVWCTTTAFTTARKDTSAFAYNGILYLVGGFDGTNNLSDTQYSVIGTNGDLGSWSSTTRNDYGQRARQVVAANGYVYFFGNESTGTDVNYAAINSNNTLGNLYRTGVSMTGVHQNGGAVYWNGFVYEFGGCTAYASGGCTTASLVATVHYVGQRANARLGHYSKLFNTQVDTSPSQLQVNGTLASGGSVVNTSLQTAQSGQALGTAQVFNPTILGNQYLIQALDSTGTNVGTAFNYYIFLTLDDSGSGTFPDTGSTVTDFTIYYHANPGRRLRHGASFTNTGCSGSLSATTGCSLDTAP